MFGYCAQLDFEQVYKAPTVSLAGMGQHIGQLGMTPDGSLWRLFKAGAAISNPLQGCGSYDQPEDVTPSATAVGSRTLIVNSSVATKNLYAGGTIIIGAAAAYRRFYHISGNTATSGGYSTLYLAHPILYAIAGSEWATIVCSPFRDVRSMTAAAGYMSVCCMPLQTVTSAYYAWGKVRGPVFGIVMSTVPGAAAYDRLVVFHTLDGSLLMADEAINANQSNQIAGWLIPRTGGTYAGGDQTLMLQLE